LVLTPGRGTKQPESLHIFFRVRAYAHYSSPLVLCHHHDLECSVCANVIAQQSISTIYFPSAQGDQDGRTWESLQSIDARLTSKERDERFGIVAYKFGAQHALDLDWDEVVEDTMEDVAISSTGSWGTAVPQYMVI